jgi:hypothetical protein
MKKLFPFLIFSLVVTACNNNSKKETIKSTDDSTTSAKEQTDKDKPAVTGQGRYGLKSARVVTVSVLPNNMGNSTTTLYFDNYGKNSYSETVSKFTMQGAPAQPKNYSIQQDDLIYSWTEGEKTGTLLKIGKIADLGNIDFENLGKEMMEEMKIKKAGNETWLGKNCEVIEMNSETLGKGKILTWKNITMLSDMTTMGMKIRAEVKELEENPAIDPEKFNIPSDVVFKEMTMRSE